MAPNAAASWNPITGIVPVPGVTDNPTFVAANKKATSVVPGLGGIAAVGDFFSRLSEPNTWLRIAEVAVGGLLIYVSLKAMFPGTVGAAAHSAGTVAKVAAVA
jgi:hypothetical protein